MTAPHHQAQISVAGWRVTVALRLLAIARVTRSERLVVAAATFGLWFIARGARVSQAT